MSSSLVILILTQESIEPLFLFLCSLKMRLASSMLLLRLVRVVSSYPPMRIFSLEADLMRKCLLVLRWGRCDYYSSFGGVLII
jgi:hypothetical protein